MQPPGDVGPDVEQSGDWLDGLFELNRVIADTGEALEGSLCYEHRDPAFVDSPPDPRMRAKRDLFRQVAVSHRSLLEVGVNGGHSAYVALTANPELRYHGVDICDHAYVEPAIAWLQERFPGRVTLTAGSSLEVLPRLHRQGLRFDAFHVDGAKSNYFLDILHVQLMVDGRQAVVIIDDTEPGSMAAQTLQLCKRRGILSSAPDHPAPGADEVFRNEAALLAAPRPGAWQVHLAEAVTRRALWRARLAVWRLQRDLSRRGRARPSG
jgi:hypothetical protein